MNKFDIIGLGESCVDCLLRVPSNADLTQELEVLEWSIQGGGKVATAIIAASRLGTETSIMTKIGDGEAGNFVISDFEKYKVDISHIVVQKGCQTEICFILVDEKTGVPRWVGTEVIRNWPLPEKMKYMIELAEAQKHKKFPSRGYTLKELRFVTKGKILHLDGFFHECPKAAKIAKQNQIQSCYDLDIPLSMYIPKSCFDNSTNAPIYPKFIEFLKNISYLIPSRKAAVELTKKTDANTMCKKLLEYGPESVVVTLGEEGSLLMTKEGEIVEQKAFKVPVIDTTGAGDVFHGAFCFGLLKGWDHRRIMEFASVVSALKCTKLGGRVGIPTLSEVKNFLRSAAKSK